MFRMKSAALFKIGTLLVVAAQFVLVMKDVYCYVHFD